MSVRVIFIITIILLFFIHNIFINPVPNNRILVISWIGYSYQYDILKYVLSSYAQVVRRSSGDVYNHYSKDSLNILLEDVGLVVFVDCHPGHVSAVSVLIELALRRGVSVLFVPCGDGYHDFVLRVSGLGLAKGLRVSNVSTSVIVDDVVTRGVWRVGVVNYSLYYYFNIYDSGLKGVVFSDESWWFSRYPLVVVGKVGKSRVAAVAPFLFAEDVYDNRRLLDNIVRWLLYMDVPEPVEAVPEPLKNLTVLRNRLEEEVRNLTLLRDKLLNETAYLKMLAEKYNESTCVGLESRVKELEAKLNETESSLEKLVAVKEELESLKSSYAGLENQVLWAYRLLGIATAVGIATGFIVGWLYTRRKSPK